MKHGLIVAIALATMAFAHAANAEEQSVMLKIDNFYCASCAYILQITLADITGVADCTVSYGHKTALVTYDDAKTDIATLTGATAELGFPSRVVQQ